MQVFTRMSIAKRFSFYVLLITVFLSSIFITVEFISSYNRELDRMTGYIEQIQKSHTPFLISSLWLTNYDLLNSQLESIVQFDYIERAEVLDEEGTLFSAGKTGTPGMDKHSEELLYSYKENDVHVGRLTLFIDNRQLRADIITQEIPSITFHLALAVLIACTVAFLFHHMIAKHLHKITAFMKHDDYSSLDTPLSLDRRIHHNDEVAYLSVSLNDMRNRISNHIDEKELLMNEVHHRIKNNMATIQSLLSLQAEKASNREAVDILHDAMRRLKSMSFLYDKLYRTGNVSDLSVKEYLSPLVDEIINQFFDRTVSVKKEIGDLILDTKTLSPLGIIINELITNSIKHAFTKETNPTIMISVKRTDERSVEFVYHDNGIGIPESVISGETAGLGLTLIKALTNQIDGGLAIESNHGTQFRIVFPANYAHHSIL